MSVSVSTLVERLGLCINKEIQSKEEAKSLQSKLKKILDGLQDAERERVTNNAVKVWLMKVEAVSYEMEDVLDEWEMLDLQVKWKGVSPVDPSSCLKEACSLVLSLCSSFKSEHLGRRELTNKMKALRERIDILLLERVKYKFLTEKNDQGQEFNQEASTSFDNKFEVYGRDSEKNSLVTKLITSAKGEVKINTQIVSIVGIGGVGKTTLAQLAYNDPEVDEFFDLKRWVSVSEPFDTSVVAKAILEQFGVGCADSHDLDTQVQLIKRELMGKKFLVVLDNVSTEDEKKWRNLMYCLQGSTGSRILVTTRNETTARMMGTTQWERLKLLPDSECCKILNGIALRGKSMKESKKLQGIGVEIAKKCSGLPLSARCVGSMLATKSSVEEWRAILESPLWKHEEVSNVFQVLNLSYTDLSPTLKRCFSSSAILPKGATINSDEIIRIWMAYGYLGSNTSFDYVQNKGLGYLYTLELRSFFQKLESNGDNESYKLHDLMHDIANTLLENEYTFVMDGRALSNFPWLSIGKLRTFCASNVFEGELPLKSLSQLKSVKLLSLCNCNLQLLPEEVGELLHLRYLDLSNNPLWELPLTVCNLYNLQTLGIENCENLSSLPEGFGNLIQLRHFLNSGTTNLVQYPQGFEQLTGLWTLREFNGSNLECLGNLNQIRGSLYLSLIRLLETGDIVEQARRGNLVDKKHLKELRLTGLTKCERIDGFVEALKPPPNLQILYIYENTGKWLSHWIQNSFNNLTDLVFFGSLMGTIDLPPFATLPALEKLAVSTCLFKRLKTKDFLGLDGGASSVDRRGTRCFPKLRKLTFLLCWEWEEWEDMEEIGILSFLENLEIIACPRLEGLPHSLLRQATSLKILTISGASQILNDRYNQSGGCDRHHIDHIPKLTISSN